MHTCICRGKGSRWTRGHCCETWEFVRVIQCPLCLLPPLPDWGFQFSREAGVKRYEEWNSDSPHSPLPPVLHVLRQNTHRRWWYQSICCRKKEPYMSPLQRARWWGSKRSSQARDHYPVGGGHVSVPWAGTRAAIGAGAAGINPSYGR